MWESFSPKGIILSGSPFSVSTENSPRAPQFVFEAGLPVLGICYGQQTMTLQLGGKVEGHDEREFGRASIEVAEETPLLEGIVGKGETQPVWMSHGDRVTVCAGRLRGDRHIAQCALCDHRQRSQALLRRHVSPGSGAYA